jgi:hypothetical protein
MSGMSPQCSRLTGIAIRRVHIGIGVASLQMEFDGGDSVIEQADKRP